MPRFELDKPLPSTRVTRDLVRSLEQYIAQMTLALAANPEEEKKELLVCRATTIKDDLGTEELQTIDEHAQPTFSDSTVRVDINFRGSYKTSVRSLRITVRFANQRHQCKIAIAYEGANAREVVVGIYDGIKRCVATSPARNAIFNPSAYMDGAIGILTLFVFIAAMWAWRFMPPLVTWAVFVLWAAMYFTWSIARRVRPYVVFDSDRANRRGRAWDWLFKGVLSFLIFGTILALLRDKLFELLRQAG